MTISQIRIEQLDPAYALCLPEEERWRMAPKVDIYSTLQRNLWKKQPKEREQSMADIRNAVRQATVGHLEPI